MSASTGHVPQLAIAHALASFKRLGLNTDGGPRSNGAWVEWAEVARTLNLLESRLDDETLKAFAELYVSEHPILRLLEPLGLSALGVTQLILRANGICALYGESTHEFRGSLVRVRVRQQHNLEPCSVWWKLWSAVFTAAPSAVGQPALTLRACSSSRNGLDGTWDIPEARTLRSYRFSEHTRALLELFLPLLADLDVVEFSKGHDEQARLVREHGLTRTESRVALRIAGGLSPRETALELGIAYETVRTHLRNIFSSLKVSSQRELTGFIERWRSA